MHLRSRSPAQRPRLRILRSRKPPKQRSSAQRRPYPSHLPSVLYAELLKQWCFARSPMPSLSVHWQDTPSPTSDSERNSPTSIWRGIILGMDSFNSLSPYHTFTSTKKKLFGALSSIGPIPHHLSCLSSFSSQPSPFPLPFHSHWFSSLFSMPKQSGYSDPSPL